MLLFCTRQRQTRRFDDSCSKAGLVRALSFVALSPPLAPLLVVAVGPNRGVVGRI